MIAKVNRNPEFRRIMQLLLKNKTREYWIISCICCMIAGLLLSRALLSFSSLLITVPFFLQDRFQLNRWQLFAIGCLLLPVAISGIWSDDTTVWWNSFALKLPLLTVFLGCSSITFSQQQRTQISAFMLLSTTLAACWSCWQYLEQRAVMEAAYLKAKTLPVLMDDDHIRFSWWVVVTILISLQWFITESRKTVCALILLLVLFLVTYLHVLAAKTGLLCLYGAAGIAWLYLLFVKKKTRTALLLLGMMAGMALLAYQTLPTLRNRIQYIQYDISLLRKGEFNTGYNDAARWLSMKAGSDLLSTHPVTGVGFGDLPTAVDEWHTKHHPQSLPEERFRPANEWLVYGAGCGWPGLIFFTAGMGILLFAGTRKKISALTLSLISLLPFCIDDTLEGQNGVTILAFIVFFGLSKPVEPAS
jgi:O-antigen ligase